jgi:hypothetical protein
MCSLVCATRLFQRGQGKCAVCSKVIVDDELKPATIREPPPRSVAALVSNSYRFTVGSDPIGVYACVVWQGHSWRLTL